MHDISTFISSHILLVDTGRHSRGLGRLEQLRFLNPNPDKNSSFCYPFKERRPYFMTLIYFVLQTKFYRKHFKLTSCIKIFCENWWYHTCRPLIVNFFFWTTPGAKLPNPPISRYQKVKLYPWAEKSYPVQQHIPIGLNKRDWLLIAHCRPSYSFKSFWSKQTFISRH